MNILVFYDERAMDSYVADLILQLIRKDPKAAIGFATGSTPQGVYQQLIQYYQDGVIDFSTVTAFSLDEYVGLPSHHPNSFQTAMHQALFDHINIKKENIHMLHGDALDMEQECIKYEKLLNEKQVCLQLLGIGMDGHIAYNEPGTSFQSSTHVVDLHSESRISSLGYGFEHLDEVPYQGVTQGIATIMNAKLLVMMAYGHQKAPLVKRMLEGEVTEKFPSSIIQKHPHVIVVLDQAAAKELEVPYETH